MNKVLFIQDCSKPQVNKFLPDDCEAKFIDSSQSFLAKFRSTDLIVIDTSSEDEKRFLCQKLRRDGIGQPVIVLAKKVNTIEKVEILNHGADDVITSEIHPEEFKAKIKSLLRRPPVFYSEILRVNNLEVDTVRKEVRRGKVKIILSKTEYKLLLVLIKNKGITISRDSLFEQVWGYDSDQYMTIVDVYIRFLRKKIDEGFKKALIQTVWGVGYRLSE